MKDDHIRVIQLFRLCFPAMFASTQISSQGCFLVGGTIAPVRKATSICEYFFAAYNRAMKIISSKEVA